MFEIQKTNGKTNMDDYFYKYLLEKKNKSDDKNADNLNLPFQTAIPGSQFPINNQASFPANLQNLKFPPTINPVMQPGNMNAMNNPNLKLNFPFNQSLIQNANMAMNNPNVQNINKILLQQQAQQRMPQNNMLMNNFNYNNLINNPNFANQPNLLGLKNLAGNFPNLPIQNILNSKMINPNQQIPNFTNMQNFPNLPNNMIMNNLSTGNDELNLLFILFSFLTRIFLFKF